MDSPDTSNTPAGLIESDVLIVDDEISVLAVANAILQTIGLQAATAHDGEMARQWAAARVEQNKPISLIIMDLTMPGGLSGFETLEALRQLCPAVPVVACSGFFQEGARELCQTLGFTDVLSKPYRPELLIRMVRRVMDGLPPDIEELETELREEQSQLYGAPSDLVEQTKATSDGTAATIESGDDDESSPHRKKSLHPLMKGFGFF